jgi:replication factor A1
VLRIYHYDTTPGSVVQVLDIRRLSSGNSMAVVRFRLVVSDGHHYQQAVVVSELHARIESREVETLGLIKLTEVSCQVVAGRRVIIILGLEVVSCRVAKLGAPSNMDLACAAKSASEASQQGAKPAPAAPPKPHQQLPTPNSTWAQTSSHKARSSHKAWTRTRKRCCG